VENANFGRDFRVKERYSLNIRVEFTNIFNRRSCRRLRPFRAESTWSGFAPFGYFSAQTATEPRA
jgi:hypothetical protein